MKVCVGQLSNVSEVVCMSGLLIPESICTAETLWTNRRRYVLRFFEVRYVIGNQQAMLGRATLSGLK